MRRHRRKHLDWTRLASATLVFLAPSAARAAATVAVMPVQTVNLTEGEGDAIGVLFANAYARETHVVVASPIETKPVLAAAKTPLAAATRLGVYEHIELQAVRLGSPITVSAARFDRTGREVFRSEVNADGLDDMPNAAARLAHSLAWAQPLPHPVDVVPAETSPALTAPAGPKPYPAALGLKTAVIFPMASGRSFASVMSLQFDARIGPRSSFAEVGAGFAIPATSASGSSAIEMGGVFAEFGGGLYLSDGSVAPYLGAGLSPRIWLVTTQNSSDSTSDSSTTGATCTVHGQAGVNFTRDHRARVFAEVRVSQYIVGLTSRLSGETSTATFYPTEISLQVGIGW